MGSRSLIAFGLLLAARGLLGASYTESDKNYVDVNVGRFSYAPTDTTDFKIHAYKNDDPDNSFQCQGNFRFLYRKFEFFGYAFNQDGVSVQRPTADTASLPNLTPMKDPATIFSKGVTGITGTTGMTEAGEGNVPAGYYTCSFMASDVPRCAETYNAYRIEAERNSAPLKNGMEKPYGISEARSSGDCLVRFEAKGLGKQCALPNVVTTGTGGKKLVTSCMFNNQNKFVCPTLEVASTNWKTADINDMDINNNAASRRMGECVATPVTRTDRDPYTSAACVFYKPHPRRRFPGGIHVPGANTVDSCKQQCNADPKCRGFQIRTFPDLNRQTTCYKVNVQLNILNYFNDPDYIFFQYPDSVSCPPARVEGKCNKYTRHQHTYVSDLKYNEFEKHILGSDKTLPACEKICDDQPPCKGFQYDNTDPNSPSCHIFFADFRDDAKRSFANHTTYFSSEYIDCPTKASRSTNCIKYLRTQNKQSVDGILQSTSSLQTCQELCTADSSCFSVDYFSTRGITPTCYLHKSNKTLINPPARVTVSNFRAIVSTCPPAGEPRIASSCVDYKFTANKFGLGGKMEAGNLTLPACQRICSNNINCRAIDFDYIYTSATTGTCYTHIIKPSLVEALKNMRISHYTATLCSLPNRNVSDCTRYSLISNRHYDTDEVDEEVGKSLHDCQAKCRADVTCIGFEYDYRKRQHICRYFTNPAQRNKEIVDQDTDFYQIEKIDCPTSQSPESASGTQGVAVTRKQSDCVEYDEMPNTAFNGGVQRNVIGKGNCQNACNNQLDCIGFEMRAGSCQLFVGTQVVTTTSASIGSTHYALRVVACPGEICTTHSFIATVDVAAAGGSPLVGLSVEGCRSRCHGETACVGYMFNKNFNRCYVFYDYAFINRRTRKQNSDLYTKKKCPTTACNQNDDFTAESGKQSLGATGYQQRDGVEDCKSLCRSLPKCTGFDFDRNAATICWIFSDMEFKNSKRDNPKVTQYTKRPCGVLEQTTTSTTTSTTPKPDPITVDTGCKPTYTRFQGQGSFGGDLLVAMKTEADCQKACSDDSACLAFDFNGCSTECFRHTDQIRLKFKYTGTNCINQYQKKACTVTQKPDTGCKDTFDATPNSFTLGGTSVPGLSKRQECTDRCLADQSCEGYDYVSGGSCFKHSTASLANGRRSGSGVTQYIRRRCNQVITTESPTGACEETFSSKSNTHRNRGRSTSDQTLSACKIACSANGTCRSLDYDEGNTIKCWLHSASSSAEAPANGVTHYTKTSFNCVAAVGTTKEPGCQPKTEVHVGFNSRGGTGEPGITSESQCIQRCVEIAGCQAVDFNAASPGTQCFTHRSSSFVPKQGSLPGVRQTVILERCGASIGTTPATGGVTTNQPPVDCKIVRKENTAYAGQAVAGSFTEESCGAYCNTAGRTCNGTLFVRVSATCNLITGNQSVTDGCCTAFIRECGGSGSCKYDKLENNGGSTGAQLTSAYQLTESQCRDICDKNAACQAFSHSSLFCRTFSSTGSVALAGTSFYVKNCGGTTGATPPPPVTSDCTRTGDYALLLDSSGSIGLTEWENVRTFARNLAQRLQIGTTGNSLGIIVYSTDAEYYCDMTTSSDTINSCIAQLRFIGGHTNVPGAFRLYRNRMLANATAGDRPNIPNAIILMSDGGNTRDKDNLIPLSCAVKQAKVTVSGVGVGARTNDTEIRSIITGPSLYEKASTFTGAELEAAAGKILVKTCQFPGLNTQIAQCPPITQESVPLPAPAPAATQPPPPSSNTNSALIEAMVNNNEGGINTIENERRMNAAEIVDVNNNYREAFDDFQYQNEAIYLVSATIVSPSRSSVNAYVSGSSSSPEMLILRQPRTINSATSTETSTRTGILRYSPGGKGRFVIRQGSPYSGSALSIINLDNYMNNLNSFHAVRSSSQNNAGPIQFTRADVSNTNFDQTNYRCPTTGIYFFSYTIGVNRNSRGVVILSTGDPQNIPVGYGLGNLDASLSGQKTISRNVLMNCVAGNQIGVQLVQGTIEGNNDQSPLISFSGFAYTPRSYPYAFSYANTVSLFKQTESTINYNARIEETEASAGRPAAMNVNGIFTAPRRGYYYFYFSTGLGNRQSATASLQINGRNIFTLARQPGYQQGTDFMGRGTIAYVEAGWQVRVIGQGNFQSSTRKQISFFGFLITTV